MSTDNNSEAVSDDAAFVHDVADRLILGGAWTWADHGLRNQGPAPVDGGR